MTWPIYLTGASVALGEEASFPPLFPTLSSLEVNPIQPKQLGRGVFRFEVSGIYCYQNAAGTGIVLIRPDNPLGCADMVWNVVTASTTGNAAQSNEYYSDPAGQSKALLTKPGMRNWNCGPAAGACIEILARMGIKARLVQWASATQGQHQNHEVNLESEGGWTLYDAHFGLAFNPEIGALDVWAAGRSGLGIKNQLRLFRNKATWDPAPWETLTKYEMAMGLFGGSSVMPVVSHGITAGPIEAAIGRKVVVLGQNELRHGYY